MDYERFYGEIQQDAYHSDSAIPERQARARFELPAREGPVRRKGGAPAQHASSSGVRPSAIAGGGGGTKKDRATLRAAGAAREKKARRKNIARKQRDEEIRLFRGTVSCVCTCMELDTEKLLPAMQRYFDAKSQDDKSPDIAPAAASTADGTGNKEHNNGHSAQHPAHVPGEKACAATPPSCPAKNKSEPGSSEDEGGKDPRRRGGGGGNHTFDSQKPLRSYIKGEWTFKMYVDVLHAQSVVARDEVVNAARAELLERRSSMPHSSVRIPNAPHTHEPAITLGHMGLRDTDTDAEHIALVPSPALPRLAEDESGGGLAYLDAAPCSPERERDRQREREREMAGETEGLEDDDIGAHIYSPHGVGAEAEAGDFEEALEASTKLYVGQEAGGYAHEALTYTHDFALGSDDEFEAEIERAAATVTDLATKHVFCFQYGCMVFWGLEPDEQLFFLQFVEDFEEESILEEEHERDDMTFFYSPPGTSHPTRLYNDQVCLSSNSPLEKLSVSFSLAQSTKLMVLETRVENTFEKTRAYPQELAENGQISLSQIDVSKLIGQLFIVKSSVNLESDMLSIPDFFWDNEVWEPIFRHACKYLEIEDRVTVVNKRLEVLDGMFHMLKDQLEVRHATRLEWIVIWLIVAEVGLELIWNILIKDILGFFKD